MAKTKPIGKVVDQAATLLQKLVRMKAADQQGICQCVTCGKKGHWKEMDGGHFISRTYTQHKLNEENIHPQCKGCNRFAYKCSDDYFLFMVDMYGEDHVRSMVETKRQVKKWERVELNDLIRDLKERIKNEENRLQ